MKSIVNNDRDHFGATTLFVGLVFFYSTARYFHGGLGGGGGYYWAVDFLFFGVPYFVFLFLSFVTNKSIALFFSFAAILFGYLLIICQFIFIKNTGCFFSAGAAVYAVKEFGSLRDVLFSVDLVYPLLIIFFSIWAFLFSLILFLNGKKLKRLHNIGTAVFLFAFFVACFVVFYYKFHKNMDKIRGNSIAMSMLSSPLGDVFLGVVDRYGYEFSQEEGASDFNRPNIIIIIIESARARSFPLYEYKSRKMTAKNISRIAEKGLLFERMYATTTHTTKALVSIFCGIHPFPGMNYDESNPGFIPAKCLPEILSSNGYDTLFIQSARQDFEGRPELLANFGFSEKIYKENIESGFRSSGYFGLDEMAMLSPFKNWWSKKNDIPKFVSFLTSTSHHPYEKFEEGGDELPPGSEESYLWALDYTDRFIGSIFDFLENSSEINNTIIIIVGDHGEGFGEHALYQHDVLPYEEGINVPLVIYDGRDVDLLGRDMMLRQHIDLLPTVLRFAGVNFSGILPGLDLIKTNGHDEIMTACWYTNACFALVRDDMKYIYFPRRKNFVAFDLENDPNESLDISEALSPAEIEMLAGKMLGHNLMVTNFYLNFNDK